MMKRIICVFVSLLMGVTQQVMAQQTICNEDFEINLPKGWSYHYSDDEGIMTHFFDKDSLSYRVVVFPVLMYTHKAFMEYRPSGTKYIEQEREQIISMKDGTEMKYKKVQGNAFSSDISGCVYIADRNDKTIIIQEINKDSLRGVKDSLLGKFCWAEITLLSLPERVDRFCNVLNGIMKKVAPSLGICLKQSAKDKIFYKEQWLQSSKDEAKALAEGKLQKEDNGISEYFNFSPLLLEMGNEGYCFQESRYLMNGKLESKVVYTPKDYRHLLNR